MLKRLKLEFFRQHRDKDIQFTEGLNVIRCENERGKTSALEGLCYNWFGAKALSEKLDDVVTWGEPTKKLRTETVFELNGTEYTCVRSPAGAELTFGNKGLVTGQTQVTEYIEDLLGMPPGSAFDLLVASQNSIRGLTEGGSTALVEMIEKLTDFSQIDQIVNLIQKYLPTGNTKALENQLEQAQERAEKAEKEYKETSTATIVTSLDFTKKDLAGLMDAEQRSREHKEKANEQINELTSRDRVASMLRESLQQAQEKVAAKQKELEDYQNELKTTFVDRTEELAQHEERLAALDKLRFLHDLKEGIKNLAWTNPTFWEGTVESVYTERSRLENLAQKLNDDAVSAQATIKALTGQLVTEMVCPQCERPFENAEELEASNQRIQEQIEAQKEIYGNALEEAETIQADLGAIREILAHQKKIDVYIDGQEEFYLVDEGVVPNKVSLKEPEGGLEPYDPEEGERIAKRIREIHQETLRAQELTSRIEITTSFLEDAKSTAAYNAKRLEESQPPSKEEWEQARERLEDAVSDHKGLAGLLQAKEKEISELEYELKSIKERNEANRKYKEDIQRQLQEAEANLKEITENNELLKSVRTARTKVSDHLWSMVLNSISSYFSSMRGEKSLVEKAETGFKVNGRPAKSLSGSAKDCFGLATRFGLMRTFLPNIDLIVLDEPSHGCDDRRTAQMTSMIMTAGFDQQILVTHKSADEAGANNLIEWG